MFGWKAVRKRFPSTESGIEFILQQSLASILVQKIRVLVHWLKIWDLWIFIQLDENLYNDNESKIG